MTDKRLTTLDQEEVLRKARNGLALSLKELAIASGWGYSQWRSWKAQGLPLIAKKLPLKKAMDWVEKFEGEARAQVQHPVYPRSSVASRFHAAGKR